MKMGHVLVGIRTIVDQQVDAVDAIARLAQRPGHALRQSQQALTNRCGQVTQERRMQAADDQHMGRTHGKDIQQNDEIIVLVETMSG